MADVVLDGFILRDVVFFFILGMLSLVFCMGCCLGFLCGDVVFGRFVGDVV